MAQGVVPASGELTFSFFLTLAADPIIISVETMRIGREHLEIRTRTLRAGNVGALRPLQGASLPARGKIDPAIGTRPGRTCILAFPSGLPSLTLTWAPAYIADGADALATMESKAARVEFERLGSESQWGQDDPNAGIGGSLSRPATRT